MRYSDENMQGYGSDHFPYNFYIIMAIFDAFIKAELAKAEKALKKNVYGW
jgi:hypothetical protein